MLGTSESLEDLAPITPEALAGVIERSEIPEQLLSGMVMASLAPVSAFCQMAISAPVTPLFDGGAPRGHRW